ncbi:putative Ceramide glucosyltransferase [Candidatus Sulfotelmatobacter kueseliae]|jgi:ceramide glucosyltransferase|uniref:Putative Ceramide glucosyltransferase n=1 Tax=Candidatus Sulfotelmatobacter kueseliae TaxID=2042962 RepID=A0A2U3K033_9BACT|nr:putative Ceramide glucosyltransferase [Candidatus Sulfotelmatobacter kueseliae]
MIYQTVRALEIIAALATTGSLVYYALGLWSAANFLRTPKRAAPASMAPVSILKPLKGTDPEMYENFRSHCVQDYPEYEIIFGVSEPDDPAVKLVEQLKTEFPQRAIQLIVCPKQLGTNTKVSNLAQMLPQARYDHLIVNDSDIRVEPDYLRRVLAPLADSRTGLVTCLYRGAANSTLGSRLESLGISTDFCPGVLVARQLEGIKFALGSTMAFRRRDLAAIGGFEALADYLSDDYRLGNRIAALGLKVELSNVVVETFLPRYTMREFLAHQLRWARAVRDSRPWGYLGLGITFGLVWALLTLILAGGAGWAWELLFGTAAMRLAVAIFIGGRTLRDRHAMRWLPLIPLRDAIATLVWLISFAGHTVSWRGDVFKLRDGKLRKASP